VCASISEYAGESILNVFDPAMDFMYKWLMELRDTPVLTDTSNKKRKVNVKGSIIECMTIMCHAAGRAKTQSISAHIVEVINSLQVQGFK